MTNSKFLFTLIAVLACGLIAAGCGGDDSTTADDAAGQVEDATTDAPQSVEEAQDQAAEALENAPESIDDAIQQCIDQAENSGLPDDQAENLKDLCESGGDVANDALENQGNGG